MIVLYKETEKNFDHNGIGVLDKHILNDLVSWVDNGLYTFTFDYPLFAPHGPKIKGDCIVKTMTPDGEQLFRIHSPRTDNGMLSIGALHISYDLAKNLIEDTFIVSKSGHEALQQMSSKTQYGHDFTFSSDINVSASSRVVRKNPIQFLIDSSLDNSFVNRWGGHIKRDNFHIEMNESLGKNRGVVIRDRREVKGYVADLDFDSIVTRIMPQGFDGLLLPEKYVDSPLINSYHKPKIEVVEFNNVKAQKPGQRLEEDEVPLDEAYNLLRQASKQCYSRDKYDLPKSSYKIDFIDLSKTDEYEEFSELIKIMPGDTVHFVHEDEGISIEAEMNKYTYCSTTEEYITMELGNYKPTFTNIMNEVKTVQESITVISKEIATDLIHSGFGGHVRIYPDKILIMDEFREEVAKRVWQWNINGFGYSKNGINGKYGLAMTMNGEIVADFITVGTIRADVFENSFDKTGDTLRLNSGILYVLNDNRRIMQLTKKGLEFWNSKDSIGKMGTTSKPLSGMFDPDFDEVSQQAISVELDKGGKYIQLLSKNKVGIYIPNPDHYPLGSDIIIAAEEKKTGIMLSSQKAGVLVGGVSEGKVRINAPEGLIINGQEYTPGGTGGGTGGGNLGSREEYAKNMITDLFNADYEKVYASYLNYPRIKAWGIANRSAFNELNEIIRRQGVSPVFFWAYEGSEGYHPELSFLNHFYRDGSSYQEEAKRTAAWIKATSLTSGDLAWYDAQYPYYTSPPDKQAVGNAYMAETKPGMIARVMLQGTAAATWAMFDPAALSGSVNGKQDYADPFAHQMSFIKSWQAEMKYIKPMSQYIVTSEFGWRDAPMNPGTMEFHNAIDLASNGGRGQIFASNDGVVVQADGNYWSWYGNYVVIQHADGLFTGYAHLSQINVQKGQRVSRGQLIGIEGATGPVTGPHLHFQFMKHFWPRDDNDFENPRKYIQL